MSSKLLQESYVDLQQMRRTATDVASQQAVAHGSQLIEQRTALLFEQLQAEPSPEDPEADAGALPGHKTNIEGVPRPGDAEAPTPPVEGDTIPAADGAEAPAAGTDITPDTPPATTEPSVGDQPAEESWEDLIQKLLTTDPAASAPGDAAPDPEMTSSQPQDLTNASDTELIREFLEADNDVKIDIMQEPEAPQAEPTARSFADVLKETLGDDLEQSGQAPEGEAPITAPEGEAPAEPITAPEGEAPAEPEADAALGAELNALDGGEAETDTVVAPEAPTANAQELADAIASLGNDLDAPETENPESGVPAALNEGQVTAIRQQFELLSEGTMKLAAKNKNLERELQILREQNEQLQGKVAEKEAMFSTLKGHLYESVVLTTKTALANQLLMEHTTGREEKVLIMESLGAATTRDEATMIYGTLTEKIQKNTLLKEGIFANQQVGRVFTAETGLLKESAIAKSPEDLNPMVERWNRNANYKPVK